jgi:hypothetical protein
VVLRALLVACYCHSLFDARRADITVRARRGVFSRPSRFRL